MDLGFIGAILCITPGFSFLAGIGTYGERREGPFPPWCDFSLVAWNSIPKIGCHCFWLGIIALPNNTLPVRYLFIKISIPVWSCYWVQELFLHGITGSKLGSGVRQVYISVVRVNGLGLTLCINVKQCKTKYIHIILRVHIKKN